MIPARKTRKIHVRGLPIGGDAPIAVQSMAATRTRDLDATLRQVEILEAAGADLVRIAVDSQADVDALAQIRERTSIRLSVDLQENYRLATAVAPHVDKIRYNPGHLHHHEKERPVEDKVLWIAGVAREHDCAIRIGVNAGSIAPSYQERFGDDHVGAIVACAVDHCGLLDAADFHDFVVSIKDSDPRLVIDANQRFAELRPDRPAAPGGHRSRHAARRDHQDAHRVRTAALARDRRHDPGLADGPVRRQRSRDRGRTRADRGHRKRSFSLGSAQLPSMA